MRDKAAQIFELLDSVDGLVIQADCERVISRVNGLFVGQHLSLAWIDMQAPTQKLCMQKGQCKLQVVWLNP